MRRKLVCVLGGMAIGWGGLIAPVEAAPGSTGASWKLDIKFHDPQRISLRLPGDSHATTFWYMLYEVANHTGEDRGFYPSFRLVTDTLKVVEGGVDISPSVYDAIAERHKGEFPFMAPPAKITGLLLQGNENARASVVVFRSFDQEADGFAVYVSGLSGEILRVANPGLDKTAKVSDANPEFFLLRRTLGITYDIPGDARTRSRVAPVRRTREWVMR